MAASLSSTAPGVRPAAGGQRLEPGAKRDVQTIGEEGHEDLRLNALLQRVIQQTVAHLGELDEGGRIEARALARRLIGAPEEALRFNDGSDHVTAPVRLKGVRVERSRQFGDVYLALCLWRGAGLEDLCRRLLPMGQERVAWARMAAVLVTARLCEPSREPHIAQDWYRRAALCDLLQLGDKEANKDRLYRGLDRLLAHKAIRATGRVSSCAVRTPPC